MSSPIGGGMGQLPGIQAIGGLKESLARREYSENNTL